MDKQVYSKDVLDFVKASASFCLTLENARSMMAKDLVNAMLSELPYLYNCALMLTEQVIDNGLGTDAQVTEEDYNFVRLGVYDVLAQYDEYLDVFVEDMKYSDRPILRSISEDLADIYQDLRNFLATYREGLEEMMAAALFEIIEGFKEDWGQKCVNVMRPLHDVKFKQMTQQD